MFRLGSGQGGGGVSYRAAASVVFRAGAWAGSADLPSSGLDITELS